MTDSQLTQLNELLERNRNTSHINMVKEAEDSDGFFNPDDVDPGTLDDAFYFGQELGAAVLVEDILNILNG